MAGSAPFVASRPIAPFGSRMPFQATAARKTADHRARLGSRPLSTAPRGASMLRPEDGGGTEMAAVERSYSSTPGFFL